MREPKRRKYVPDLVHMGAHFEGNYHRLRRLMNLLSDQESVIILLNIGDHYVGRVSIKLLENTPYTDTLLLEQTASAGKWVNDPSMTVRVYHDVAVAEVISSKGHRRIEATNQYPNRFMHHPDEKSQLNAFLSEWLSFVLAHGCAEKLPYSSP